MFGLYGERNWQIDSHFHWGLGLEFWDWDCGICIEVLTEVLEIRKKSRLLWCPRYSRFLANEHESNLNDSHPSIVWSKWKQKFEIDLLAQTMSYDVFAPPRQWSGLPITYRSEPRIIIEIMNHAPTDCYYKPLRLNNRPLIGWQDHRRIKSGIQPFSLDVPTRFRPFK